MTATPRDIFLLHFIVLVWGFTAVLGLLISIPPVEVVFFRTSLAAIILAGILFMAKKPFQLSHRRDLLKVILVGLFLAAHWILFFLSARFSNVSVCLVGMATTSFWTSLIEPLYFKKKIQGYEIVLSIMALAGISVIFKVEFDYVLGISCAVVAALFAALFSIINVSLTQQNDHFTITYYEMLFASLVILAFVPVYLFFNESGSFAFPTLSDWGYLLILSGVCTVFAFSYSVKLMKKLSAYFINLTINLEPIYGILLALIFFGESEKMSAGFYLGALCILASVLMYPILNRRYRRKALEREKIG